MVKWFQCFSWVLRGYYFVAAGACPAGGDTDIASPLTSAVWERKFAACCVCLDLSNSSTLRWGRHLPTRRVTMVTAESRWFCGPIGACSGPGPAAGYRSLQGAVPGRYDPLGRKSSTPGSWILLLLGNQRGAAACVGAWLSIFWLSTSFMLLPHLVHPCNH